MDSSIRVTSFPDGSLIPNEQFPWPRNWSLCDWYGSVGLAYRAQFMCLGHSYRFLSTAAVLQIRDPTTLCVKLPSAISPRARFHKAVRTSDIVSQLLLATTPRPEFIASSLQTGDVIVAFRWRFFSCPSSSLYNHIFFMSLLLPSSVLLFFLLFFFLPYWSFQLYISLWKFPSALI